MMPSLEVYMISTSKIYSAWLIQINLKPLTKWMQNLEIIIVVLPDAQSGISVFIIRLIGLIVRLKKDEFNRYC